MTSSSPSHVIGVTSASPPRQLSVCDLFNYQRPRQSQPSIAAALSHQHRPTVNMAADHVTPCYWPEPEVKDAEQRRARRLPASSSSFDDSAIDNQSAPSTSSGGSRGRNGGSRVNQSGLSTSSAGSRYHDVSNGDTSSHHRTPTRTVAIIRCSPGDVMMTSQANMAAVRQGGDDAKRSRAPTSSSRETDAMTVDHP